MEEDKKKTYYSEVNRRASEKHIAANYEQLVLRVRKGKRDKIKQLAESQGKSMQAYIFSLIEDDAKRLGFDMTVPPTPSQQKKEK